VTPEERENRIRAIFGLPEKPGAEPVGVAQEPVAVQPDQTKSNQIKPNEGRTDDQLAGLRRCGDLRKAGGGWESLLAPRSPRVFIG
jgi:hypothetical protein